MVELVLKPWVRIVATPQIDVEAIVDFAEAHDLTDIIDDDKTPLGGIARQAEGMNIEDAQHADLLAEFAGRFCYRSWAKGRSTDDYLANVISERHGNVLAHASVSFIVSGVSRSLTHELVRHHVGTNPSQESQRYVTAEGGELEIVGYRATRAVVPPMIVHLFGDSPRDMESFREQFQQDIERYHGWLDGIKAKMPGDWEKTMVKKRANEAARCWLPNATETRLVWTMNLRAARHVIERRGDVHADLEIRRLAVAFTHELKRVAPISFADAEVYTAEDGFEAVRVAHYGV